jgi:hypothetical protein
MREMGTAKKFSKFRQTVPPHMAGGESGRSGLVTRLLFEDRGAAEFFLSQGFCSLCPEPAGSRE